jgi:hypothetical protein
MSGFQPPVLPSNVSHGRLCDPGTAGMGDRGAFNGARLRRPLIERKENRCSRGS